MMRLRFRCCLDRSLAILFISSCSAFARSGQVQQRAEQQAQQEAAPAEAGRDFNPERQVFRRGVIYTNDRFRPGQVISFPHHVLDQGLEPESDDLTITNNGFWVFTKIRKYIIIKLYFSHCITIPIFSFRGNGLENSPNRDEYIGVRDSARPNMRASESNHENIMFLKSPQWRDVPEINFHQMHPRSHAK